MKIKAVNVLKGGEVLAEPVVTKENDILIPKGTVLKEEYIPLIQSLEIDALMIEDPYEDYETPNSIIGVERLDRYVERVRKIMEGYIHNSGDRSLKEFEIIANDIVKDINNMPKDVIIDIKERSANLYDHSVMVTLLSVMVARKLKLDQKKQYNIAVGCLLHDIGIRFITAPYENISLEGVDPATLFEFKKHTILGFSALEEESWVSPISMKMILSHHENLEGTGFPMKQKSREIECRIIQACDAFDCYISGMECKRMSVQETLAKMVAESDGKYEKRIIDSIVSVVAKYPVGTTVETNALGSGVVISQTIDPENPIIMILDASDDDDNLGNTKLNLMLEKNISILRVV